MPTSLRTLLDKPAENALSLDLGTSPNWQREEVESHVYTSSYSKNSYCADYDNACGCCCSWGPPGGAGAYTKLTVNNTSNGYSQCICMCVAPGSCCSPNSCCGYRGCKSYINAANLCNICAEGGLPGCGFCDFYGCFPTNGCGILAHPNAIECAGYCGCATNEPTGTTVCATGIPGKHGWLQSDCNNPSDFCWYKVAFPIPGGLGTNETSYKLVRAFCNTGTSADHSRVGGVADNAIGGGTCDFRSVGQGGNTARVCGGGCCCGYPGGPGLIKISWK
jgi:hypothetical protein